MTSKQKNILIISIAAVFIIGLVLLLTFTGRIPENDPDTAGNTPGNLNNGGYFCESDDRVYFANAYDNYALYSMNPDETDMVKLDGNSVSYINAAGKYLYYYMTSESGSGSGLGYMGQSAGIYRSEKNGKNTAGLGRCNIVTMQLCGNYLYYETYNSENGTSLDKIRIDKTDQQTVAEKIINPNCFTGGRIYYNGTDGDHYLYALDVRTDRSSLVWQGDLWNPIVQGNYVYYMDISENYRLCRYNMTDQVVEVLTNERLDMFNVYDSYIYYQVSSADSPALKRMRTDGSSQELVREGIYQNINITSEYVYFNTFNESVPVYRTYTYGPVNVTTFDAAREAALENLTE
ncbi:MAG: DUF5050 domain-containing protein [Bacteroidales bacterium]|nr:DUF5050 domain-containing protein [Bacteroidales bacterium]MCM1415814.1 DUF5050 domain-containing protein [bacterium]MCM1423850.1 DUF5050 domain-containing protein [bacterium]